MLNGGIVKPCRKWGDGHRAGAAGEQELLDVDPGGGAPVLPAVPHCPSHCGRCPQSSTEVPPREGALALEVAAGGVGVQWTVWALGLREGGLGGTGRRSWPRGLWGALELRWRGGGRSGPPRLTTSDLGQDVFNIRVVDQAHPLTSPKVLRDPLAPALWFYE